MNNITKDINTLLINANKALKGQKYAEGKSLLEKILLKFNIYLIFCCNSKSFKKISLKLILFEDQVETQDKLLLIFKAFIFIFWPISIKILE